MATIQILILKHHKKADGTFNPKFQIIHNRTKAYMPTAIYTQFVRFKKGQTQGVITESTIEDQLNKKVAEIRNILNERSEIIDSFKSALR